LSPLLSHNAPPANGPAIFPKLETESCKPKTDPRRFLETPLMILVKTNPAEETTVASMIKRRENCHISVELISNQVVTAPIALAIPST